MNLKNTFKVLVGGGALQADMVTKIGADGFAREPQSIVPEAERLMKFYSFT
jgi:methanogenic corrinoid protein MtbC1